MGAGMFPSTRRSAVMSIGSDDPVERARSFDVLVRAYWKPVYKYVRMRWKSSPDQARDLTQGLFARAFEKQYFSTYDPSRARFRTFLKTCLDRYVMEQNRAEQRIKRGGDVIRVSLDFDVAESELGQSNSTPDDTDTYFEREWMRALLGAAVDSLHANCERDGKVVHFACFERLVLDPAVPKPTYRDIANALNIKVTDVTNHLAWARRSFRGIVLDQLREITSSDEEFRAEARLVLGEDV
jgi:RNA polymerase sigma factor (sigma-70 family)